MKSYSLTHLGDQVLLRGLESAVARERGATTDVLAHIGEAHERRLFLAEGFPSMHEYCIRHLHLSKDAAHKRIQAAGAARRFPAIFEAVAAGRLHLTAVRLLAPHLTAANAAELLAAATHKSKAEVEQLLAERFPRSEMLTLVQALPGSPPRAGEPRVRGPLGRLLEAANVTTGSGSFAPGQMDSPAARPRVTPLASERFALQTTIDRSTYEDLEYARALLSHRLPASEIPAVLARALRGLVLQLEKTRFAATRRPRSGRPHSSANPRHIPAGVKRTVWLRDGGQCSFVSESGQRCPARSRLEFDHIQAVARGGEATVANLRLVCRGHNQYEAERVFGAGFMSEKREAARGAAQARRHETAARAAEVAEARRQESVARATEAAEVLPPGTAEQAEESAPRSAESGWQEAAKAAEAAQRAAEAGQEFAARAEEMARGKAEEMRAEAVAKARRQEIVAWAEEAARRKADEARVKAAVEEIITPLRILGCRADEARRIAATCATIADAPLEERLRFAIRQLAPRHRTVAAAP